MESYLLTGKTYRDARHTAILLGVLASEQGYKVQKYERGDITVIRISDLFEITFVPIKSFDRFMREHKNDAIETFFKLKFDETAL